MTRWIDQQSSCATVEKLGRHLSRSKKKGREEKRKERKEKVKDKSG
jgi:hypothetical protein